MRESVCVCVTRCPMFVQMIFFAHNFVVERTSKSQTVVVKHVVVDSINENLRIKLSIRRKADKPGKKMQIQYGVILAWEHYMKQKTYILISANKDLLGNSNSTIKWIITDLSF